MNLSCVVPGSRSLAHFTLDGKAYEAPQGVAHYLEHMMFAMPWGEVSADFAAMGACILMLVLSLLIGYLNGGRYFNPFV